MGVYRRFTTIPATTSPQLFNHRYLDPTRPYYFIIYKNRSKSHRRHRCLQKHFLYCIDSPRIVQPDRYSRDNSIISPPGESMTSMLNRPTAPLDSAPQGLFDPSVHVI